MDVHFITCAIKNKNPGWTSDEGHTLEYLPNVPETPNQVSGPHLWTHVVPGGNYFCLLKFTLKYIYMYFAL